ncbi:DUF3967 domain-containing protein [Virgibacillus necropolis]|uniref:DUF3967 domain-containing protein n=1 Tax=Virgibacillus necropolis TaxID=163877 RepID=UPI00384FCBB5
MSEQQTIYDTKNIAELFQIHASTVRKYCDFLEKEGYQFHKNEYGHRGFFDDDVIVLRKLIDFKGTMALEKATKSVIAWKNGDDVSGVAIGKKQYSTEYSNLLDEFKTFQKQQHAFNQELLEQLKKQQGYIDTRLEERDQNLMIAMSQSLETQKQLAATKQKKWWKFWKQ